jgi:integrase
VQTDKSKPTRSATRPIPAALRETFYLSVWDLAWSGHFYRHVPDGANQFLQRFGSGSLIARRHGLTILWLTALAGRFNELASLLVHDVSGDTVELRRSKRGAVHVIRIDPELLEATKAWHARLMCRHTRLMTDGRASFEAMANSPYLLPSITGSRLNVNVFNRDVAGPLGRLFGCKLSSHSFRDTACQEAMQLVKGDANLDVRAVQALMGHRSIRTTEIYLRKQQSEQLCLSLFSGKSHG